MAVLRFSDLDLYALLDSDTDEARAFTTYLGYWVCLAEHIQEEHGDPPYERILADLQVRRQFVRIGSRPKPSDATAATMRTLLLNGWTSELRLHLIDAEPESTDRSVRAAWICCWGREGVGVGVPDAACVVDLG